MRPLRLTLNGFTSFKDETTLDFTGLELFVISGPTGAGKSSLLDAVTYALYGEVPRTNRQGLADFIALGRTKLSVTLEFKLLDQRFRVTRTASRGRSSLQSKAVLERVSPTGYEPIEEGVTKVDAALRKLLGMSREAFTQAVVLPQGQFAAFLESEPRKRRQMLNELLRLQIFERMQKQASSLRSDCEIELASLQRRVREDFAGVSPDIIAARRSELAVLEQALEAEQGRCKQCQSEMAALRHSFTHSQELSEKEASLNESRSREASMAALERSLERAQAAAILAPLLDQADREALAWTDLRRQGDLLEAELPSLQARLTQAKAHREAAESTQQDRARLEERKLRIAQVVAKHSHRQRLAAENKSAEVERDAKNRILVERRLDRTRIENERTKVAATLADIDQKLAATSLEPGRLPQLEAGQTIATRLQFTHAESLRLERDAARLAKASDAARKRWHDAVREKDLLTQEKQTLAEKLAPPHCRAQRDAHQAQELQHHLALGEPCPVCLRPVESLPTFEDIERRQRRAADFARDQSALRDVEERLSQAAAHEAAAQATAQQAAQQTGSAEQHAADHQQLLARLSNELLPLLHPGPTDPLPDGERAESLVTRFQETLAETKSLHQRHESLSREQALLRQKQAGLEQQLRQSSQSLDQLEEERRLAQERLDRFHESLREVDAEIATVAVDGDPQKELEQIDHRLKQQEQAVARARQEESTLAQQCEGIGGRLDQHRQEAAKTADRASAAAERVRAALEQSGFMDGNAARAAQFTDADLEAKRRELSAYRHKRHALEERVRELESALAGRRVSAGELAAAEQQYQALEQTTQKLFGRVVQLGQDVRRQEEALGRLHSLTQEETRLQEQLAIFRPLADDLKSDRFQAYLLEETLVALVRGASQQLARLTGDRLGLEFAGDAIKVIDHDNAGERRSTDTLSGGESFQASLALALELSAQVQRAVGAVSLDCLFIDEGFGSLDPESLGVVTESVRNLQVGGRMVGIITHLSDLVEQFDQRVVVEKKGGASSVRVEGE